MLEDLLADDFYIAFGKRARVLPDDATKETHEAERGGLKTVALGVGYGMQEQSLAVRLAKTCPEARELLQLHRRTFPRFWQWNDDVVQYGKLYGKIWTTYGWELNVTADTKVQHAAQLLDAGQRQRNAPDRLLSVCRAGGLERGFLLAGPVHDALLIECAIDDVDDAIDFTRGVMSEASRAVLDGFALGVDVKVWRHPRPVHGREARPGDLEQDHAVPGASGRGAKSQRFGPESVSKSRRYRCGNAPPVLLSLISSHQYISL